VSSPHFDPQGPPPRSSRGISARTTILLFLVAFVVLVGIGALIAGPISSPKKAPSTPKVEAAASVQLEPTSSPGENPFMAPVGTDQADVTAPAKTAGQFAGDTPGLFADNGNQTSCDGKTLVANLQSDPPRVTAWSSALGITPPEVPNFVNTLTPVVLRTDTSVTQHGYLDGTYSPYPAVLQAGTAVFVDSYGEPTVKCYSGNPLTAPQADPQPKYVGVAWRTFQPTFVTYIRPTTVVINEYTFIDVHIHRPIKCKREHWWPRRHHDNDWDHVWDKDKKDKDYWDKDKDWDKNKQDQDKDKQDWDKNKQDQDKQDQNKDQQDWDKNKQDQNKQDQNKQDQNKDQLDKGKGPDPIVDPSKGDPTGPKDPADTNQNGPKGPAVPVVDPPAGPNPPVGPNPPAGPNPPGGHNTGPIGPNTGPDKLHPKIETKEQPKIELNKQPPGPPQLNKQPPPPPQLNKQSPPPQSKIELNRQPPPRIQVVGPPPPQKFEVLRPNTAPQVSKQLEQESAKSSKSKESKGDN
jgi:hypothetical protein